VLQERADMKAMEKEYDQVMSDVITDVSVAYFEYHRALSVLDEQEKTIEQSRPFAEMSKRKMDEEVISEIEDLNVKSLFSQIEFDYETSKQELELAKLELESFLDVVWGGRLSVSKVFMILRSLSSAEKHSKQKRTPTRRPFTELYPRILQAGYKSLI